MCIQQVKQLARSTLVTTIPLSMWFMIPVPHTLEVKPFSRSHHCHMQPFSQTLLVDTSSNAWYCMAEQLLNTIMIATISSLVFLTTAWTDQQQRQHSTSLKKASRDGWIE